MAREDDFTVKTILLDLKDDIKDLKKDVKDDIHQIHDKLDTAYNMVLAQREVVKQLSNQMSKMTEVVTVDTKDRPSLVNQVRDLSKEIPQIHSKLNETSLEVKDLRSNATPKEIRIEKWKIVGQISTAIVATAAAGILAYFGLT